MLPGLFALFISPGVVSLYFFLFCGYDMPRSGDFCFFCQSRE
jgi:hypothetical protein